MDTKIVSISSKNGLLTMSSLEIAELTGKRHDHVMRDIRVILVELYVEGGVPKFGDTHINPQNGQAYPIFRLPKRETLILVSGYNVQMRAKIIDRWQELEAKELAGQQQSGFRLEPTQGTSALPAAKEFKALFSIGRLIGLDKNVAAISANNAVIKMTGQNMLQMIGHDHLTTENQEGVLFTPTELGKKINPPISAVALNRKLVEAGLQYRDGEHWMPTAIARGHHRLLDTGKKHRDGAMVQQIKWHESVLKLID